MVIFYSVILCVFIVSAVRALTTNIKLEGGSLALNYLSFALICLSEVLERLGG